MWISWSHSEFGPGSGSAVQLPLGMVMRFRDPVSAASFVAIVEKRYGASAPVYATPERDYGYRCDVSRTRLAGFLDAIGQDINYGNFKDSVADRIEPHGRAAGAYLEMLTWTWARGLEFQNVVVRIGNSVVKPRLRGVTGMRRCGACGTSYETADGSLCPCGKSRPAHKNLR